MTEEAFEIECLAFEGANRRSFENVGQKEASDLACEKGCGE